MSKLYNKYIELKNKKDDIYLFRVGIFYIFIGDDAIKMSEVLNLKCVAFTNDTVKCGFPIDSLEKYLKLLKANNIEINIVDKIDNGYDCLTNNKLIKYINKLKKMDIDKINGVKALQLLDELKDIINGD